MVSGQWRASSAGKGKGTEQGLVVSRGIRGFSPVLVCAIDWGCVPDLGWEQAGGESVPAVAGVVDRLWARRSAGARPGRTVESVSWGGCEGRHVAGTYGVWWDWRDVVGLDTFDKAPVRISTPGRRRMLLGGALRGRSPRTRKGRLGPTAQNCSDQWPVVRGGACFGGNWDGNRPWIGCLLRDSRVCPNSGMHPRLAVF